MSAPAGPGQPGERESRADPELVLAQALRALAGGKRDAPAAPDPAPQRRRVTAGQLLLIAALAGLVVGILAGIISLIV